MIRLTAFTDKPNMYILVFEGKYPKFHMYVGSDVSVNPMSANDNADIIYNSSGPGRY